MWRKQQEEGERHDFDDSVDCEASKTKTPFQYEEPFSWEEQAFAEDAAGRLGGCVWPPRSYSCSFCRREFRSAQALGGHMNVHRRDRARLKQSPNPFTNSLGLQSPAPSSSDHHLCTLANYYLPNPKTYSAGDPSSPQPNSLTSYGGRSDSLDGTKKLRISCPRVRVDDQKDHDHVGIGILDEGLSFSFGQPRPLDDGRKEAGAVSGCKRRKTDDETSIQFYVKSSSLVERHHDHHIHQSEVIGLSSGSLHDLDLELRLGGLSKG